MYGTFFQILELCLAVNRAYLLYAYIKLTPCLNLTKVQEIVEKGEITSG